MKLYISGVAVTLLFYTGSWSQVSARIGERGLNNEFTDASASGTGMAPATSGMASEQAGDRTEVAGTGVAGTSTIPNANCVESITQEGGTVTTRIECYEASSSSTTTGATMLAGDRQDLPTISTTSGVQAGKGSGMIMPAIDRADTMLAGKGMIMPAADRTDGTQVVGTVNTGNTQTIDTVNTGNTMTTGNTGMAQTTYDSTHSIDRTEGTQITGGATTGSIPVVGAVNTGSTTTTGNTYTQANQNEIYTETIDRAGGKGGGVVVTNDRTNAVTTFGSNGSNGSNGSKGSKGSKGGSGNSGNSVRTDSFAYDRTGVGASGSNGSNGSNASKASKNSKGGFGNASRTGGVATHGTSFSTSYTEQVDRTGGTVIQGSLPVVANAQLSNNQLPYVASTYNTANGFAP